MSKGIAFICLVTFFALQYGKLASYWHCRLTAASTAAICECEKFLVDTHKEGIGDSSATAIAKEKTDDSYQWEYPTIINGKVKPINSIPSPLYLSLTPEDHTSNIFQPPKA